MGDPFLDYLAQSNQEQGQKLPEGTPLLINGQPMRTRYNEGQLELLTPGGAWLPLPAGPYQVAGTSDTYILSPDGSMQKATPSTEPGLMLGVNEQGLPIIQTIDESGNVSTSLAPQWLAEAFLGGGGGPGGIQNTGYLSLPEPGQAAQLMLDYYENQVAASNGAFTAAMALANFQKDWQDYLRLYESTNLGLQRDYDLQRALLEDEAKQRQLDAWKAQQQEVTSRGGYIAQTVLPRFVPGLQSINLPFVGNLPVTQMHPEDIFKWAGAGVPGLGEVPAGAITPTPLVPAPQLPAPPPMPSLPSVPQYPAPPDISSLIGQAASGIPM